MPFSEEEFDSLQTLGHEHRGVEFKCSGKLTTMEFAATIVRAILGMSNRRDGGLVVIGVEDNNGRLEWKGMLPDDYATWNNNDLADKVAIFADPSVNFEMANIKKENRDFIVIIISEFEDTPIFCKKDFGQKLRKGALYCRSRHKPETSEVATEEDMRDLIELSTEKQLRRFIRMANAANISVMTGQQKDEADNTEFEKQRKSLQSNISDKIRSRGYWEVVIRPKDFVKERIPDFSKLLPIIKNCAVSWRGWDFPQVVDNELLSNFDGINQSVSFMKFNEEWAFFQSGQFIHYCGFYNDWGESEDGQLTDGHPSRKLDYIETLIRLFEIYELAARLAITEAGSERMCVYTRIADLEGRQLYTPDPMRIMMRKFRTNMPEFVKDYTIGKESLVSDPKRHALEVARQLFLRFDWNITIERLYEIANSIPFLLRG